MIKSHSLRSRFYMHRRIAGRVRVRHEQSGNATSRDQNSWGGEIGDLLTKNVQKRGETKPGSTAAMSAFSGLSLIWRNEDGDLADRDKRSVT